MYFVCRCDGYFDNRMAVRDKIYKDTNQGIDARNPTHDNENVMGAIVYYGNDGSSIMYEEVPAHKMPDYWVGDIVQGTQVNTFYKVVDMWYIDDEVKVDVRVHGMGYEGALFEKYDPSYFKKAETKKENTVTAKDKYGNTIAVGDLVYYPTSGSYHNVNRVIGHSLLDLEGEEFYVAAGAVYVHRKGAVTTTLRAGEDIWKYNEVEIKGNEVFNKTSDKVYYRNVFWDFSNHKPTLGYYTWNTKEAAFNQTNRLSTIQFTERNGKIIESKKVKED